MAEEEKESWAKQLAGRFVVALAVKVVWAAVTRIGLRDDVI